VLVQVAGGVDVLALVVVVLVVLVEEAGEPAVGAKLDTPVPGEVLLFATAAGLCVISAAGFGAGRLTGAVVVAGDGLAVLLVETDGLLVGRGVAGAGLA
jgi:hypothetical protein